MRILLFILFIYSTLFGFDLSINQDFGTIIKNEEVLDKPFQGGFNKPKIQWFDWIEDGVDDLFLLDEDGHLKYYTSYECEGIACLELVSTEFLNLSNILWFFIDDFDNDNEFEIITSDPINTEYIKYYNIYND